MVAVVTTGFGLTSCSGGGGSGEAATYTLGGTVAGLGAANKLTPFHGDLELTLDTGIETSQVLHQGDGTYSFSLPLEANTNFSVSIDRVPAGWDCSLVNYNFVQNGPSTMPANELQDINISCANHCRDQAKIDKVFSTYAEHHDSRSWDVEDSCAARSGPNLFLIYAVEISMHGADSQGNETIATFRFDGPEALPDEMVAGETINYIVQPDNIEILCQQGCADVVHACADYAYRNLPDNCEDL